MPYALERETNSFYKEGTDAMKTIGLIGGLRGCV